MTVTVVNRMATTRDATHPGILDILVSLRVSTPYLMRSLHRKALTKASAPTMVRASAQPCCTARASRIELSPSAAIRPVLLSVDRSWCRPLFFIGPAENNEPAVPGTVSTSRGGPAPGRSATATPVYRSAHPDAPEVGVDGCPAAVPSPGAKLRTTPTMALAAFAWTTAKGGARAPPIPPSVHSKVGPREEALDLPPVQDYPLIGYFFCAMIIKRDTYASHVKTKIHFGVVQEPSKTKEGSYARQ